MEPNVLTLECFLGPLDGDDRPFMPAGSFVHVTDHEAHRYVIALDDSGARYWRYTGSLPLSRTRQDA